MAMSRREKELIITIPADVRPYKVWVETHGGHSMAAAYRDIEEEEDAEYREVGWGPYMRWLLPRVGVAFVLFGLIVPVFLGLGDGIYQAAAGTYCHIFPAIPTPRLTP